MLHIIFNYVGSDIKMLLKTKDPCLNKFAMCIKQGVIMKNEAIQVFQAGRV